MSEWKTVRLGDYVKIQTGKLDANASSKDGKYPFFTCSIEPLKISTYSYDCECCLVAGNGDLNVKYYNGKFDAYQRTYIIESVDKEKLDVMFLYFFLSSYIEVLRKQSIGGVIKYIKLGNLTDALIPIPSLEKQKEICRNLIQAQKVLTENQTLLSKYDILIKSRFIEMFGDPTINPMGWDEIKILELCKEKDDIKCGPFGTQLSKDEYQKNGIPIFGIPQINSAFSIAPSDFLTNEKANKLKDYSLINGDIAMSRKGNVGKCAIYEGTEDGIIHSDVVRLRVDKSKSNPVYLMNQLHISPKVETQISNVSSGAIMAGINVTKLKDIFVYNPPIELQNDFATFVQQIDKSKFAVQNSLEKAETLYKSLMQEYFG